MKERITKETKNNEADRCCICGLSSSVVKELSNFDIENIRIPSVEVSVPVLKEECFCDDCMDAIKDEIWENVLRHKPKKNVAGMFFSLKKHVQHFVAEHKEEFVDIAKDYLYLLHVCTKINDCLNECVESSKLIEEIRNAPIPSVSSIRKLCSKLNNPSSDLSTHFKDFGIPGKVTGLITDTTNLTGYDFKNLLGDNELADAVGQVPSPALMLLSIKVELAYETPIIRFKIFAYNDVTASKKKAKLTKKLDDDTVIDKPTGGFTL